MCWTLGIQIAAPVMSATLLADVVLGLMGKASPQMPLMLLGPAVKSMLGVTVLLGSRCGSGRTCSKNIFRNRLHLRRALAAPNRVR